MYGDLSTIWKKTNNIVEVCYIHLETPCVYFWFTNELWKDVGLSAGARTLRCDVRGWGRVVSVGGDMSGGCIPSSLPVSRPRHYHFLAAPSGRPSVTLQVIWRFEQSATLRKYNGFREPNVASRQDDVHIISKFLNIIISECPKDCAPHRCTQKQYVDALPGRPCRVAPPCWPLTFPIV